MDIDKANLLFYLFSLKKVSVKKLAVMIYLTDFSLHDNNCTFTKMSYNKKTFFYQSDIFNALRLKLQHSKDLKVSINNKCTGGWNFLIWFNRRNYRLQKLKTFIKSIVTKEEKRKIILLYKKLVKHSSDYLIELSKRCSPYIDSDLYNEIKPTNFDLYNYLISGKYIYDMRDYHY